MANFNNATKQLIQVSFETKPLIHVPIILGNECFVITQQDVRRIEDTRHITYSKMAPNGQLVSLENPEVLDSRLLDPRILEVLKQAQKQPQQSCTSLFNAQNQVQQSNFLEPMEIDQDTIFTNTKWNSCNNSLPIIATVDQQVEWSKKPNCTSPAFPLHCTMPSNTDKNFFNQEKAESSEKSFCDRATTTTTTSSKTKPLCQSIDGARCDLKKRKVLRFCDEC